MEAIEAFPQYEGSRWKLYDSHFFIFYKALTFLKLLSSASLIKRFRLKRAIKQEINRFKKYAANGPANYKHKYLLLQAEWARSNGNPVEAEGFYEEAIKCAVKENFIQETAIANELLCRFYIENKRMWFALLFLQQAIFYYEKWGAQNKVEQLQEEFKELIQMQKGEAAEEAADLTVSIKTKSIKTGIEDRTLKIGSTALDISTIQKSMEAVTSTILMDDL